MENVIKKEKCATIYMTQTTSTVGQFSGTGVGVGMSGSGLGLGGGLISGDSKSQNQSKLAELFSPIKNDEVFDEQSFSEYFPGFGLIGAAFFLKDLLRNAEATASKGAFSNMLASGNQTLSDIVFLILSLAGGFMLATKVLKKMHKSPQYRFTNDEYSTITNNYNVIEYNYNDNTISLGDKTDIATRENFVRMLLSKEESK